MAKVVHFGRIYHHPYQNVYYIPLSLDKLDKRDVTFGEMYRVIRVDKPEEEFYSDVRSVENVWHLVKRD